MSRQARIALLCLLLLGTSGPAMACPSCYGAADSPMTAGMNAAILVMLGITGCVLSVIVSVFVYLWRRGKRTGDLSAETFVDDRGMLKSRNEKGVVEWNNY